jgi:putative methionine-R-sulfoxide reductase with GAF domain
MSDTFLQRIGNFTNAYWQRFGDVSTLLSNLPPRPPHTPGNPPRVSWCGFYQKDANADTMTLVCRQPKPACSPIGLHGMCGRGWREQKTFVVRDVKVLGENYVACDPRDVSELVVPIYASGLARDRGECWGVFDADSYDLHAFDEAHAREVLAMLDQAGLLTPTVTPAVIQ